MNDKKKNKRNKIKEKLTKVFELPTEVTLDVSKITMIGLNSILIENYNGIIEYENTNIKLNIKNGMMEFLGEGLLIKQITAEDIVIEGKIKNIEFID